MYVKGVNLVHDLNKYPYPFFTESMTEIRCIGILEHLNDLAMTMKELHRIAKDKCRIIISVPYFNSVCAFADPTHKLFFTLDTFNYFTIGYKWDYDFPKFDIIESKLIPTKYGRFIPSFLLNKLGVIFKGLVDGIHIVLEVKK